MGIAAAMRAAFPFRVEQPAALRTGMPQFSLTERTELPFRFDRPAALVAVLGGLDLTEQGFFFQGPIILFGQRGAWTDQQIEQDAKDVEDCNQQGGKDGGEDISRTGADVAPGPNDETDPEGDQEAAENSDDPLQADADKIGKLFRH